ncbi:MAG: hypothetical protein JSS76_05685 [Bacteroidetes bacterium]|nr:hypothetical protein [Bacteroidota bacterium]
MKHWKILFAIIYCIPFALIAAEKDSICSAPLKYEVLDKNADVDAFLRLAEDKHYNLYYSGSDLIIEQRKRKGTLYLVHGQSFASYQNEEMYIDSAWFQNIGDIPDRELVIRYSLFSLQPASNTKSKHLIIIDPDQKKILLNIATYDFKIAPDENGKIIDYLYEADVQLFFNGLRVKGTEDSDIDNPAIQMEDGIYHRRGRCFVKR